MPSHLSHPKYRPDIDGLRAVAVLAVVAFHAFPSWIQGGFIGVDVFFVISGYLITTIIFENLERGTFSFPEFFARRIKRIFPALIIILTACFVFGWFALLADEFKELGKHIAAGTGFVSNLVLWGESGYFDHSAETKPLLHLWSLGIEEQFYIVWPLLLWFAWKFKFNLLTVTVLIGIISFSLNINGIEKDNIATFYSPQTRFWELLCGSLLAWFTLYRKSYFSCIKNNIDGVLSSVLFRERPKNIGNICSNMLSLIGFSLLLYGFFRIDKELSFPGTWALVPVLGAVLIITSGSKAWLNRIVLSNKIAVWFGLISFPLYLWHWPILSFLRIIENGTPHRDARIIAVLLSILLAWVTYKFIEKPLRNGNLGSNVKVVTLCGLMLTLGVSGYTLYKTDLFKSYLPETYQDLKIKRKGAEFQYGPSLSWYRGKDDWLFLGNAYRDTVAKHKLAITPSEKEINAVREDFLNIAKKGAKYNTKVVLIVGPDKSSVYQEYLPDKLVPSSKKYSDFFFDQLKDVKNLTVYNPTNDFIRLKRTEGLLYWRTNTHWNNKGSFFAYLGLAELIGLPTPQVEFIPGPIHSGDLIAISKLKDFPLHTGDDWKIIWKDDPVLTTSYIKDKKKTAFGKAAVVTNEKPLSNKYVWVAGDSFTNSLKKYFNATFKEVRYIGHWSRELKDLPTNLEKADRKPDMIIVVRVERSF